MYILQQYVGLWAVLLWNQPPEFPHEITVPRAAVEGAQEGDVVQLTVRVDPEATKARRGWMRRLARTAPA